MHETTNISYGSGLVEVVLDSSSLSEVKAPDFRFGDYSKLVTSCFTQKELEKISEGESARLTFSFVMSDEATDEITASQFQIAKKENESNYGLLNEGIYIDINATKSLGSETSFELETSMDDVELQMYLPLYLVAENRNYYYLSNYQGNCELMSDASPEAEVVTIHTHTFNPGLVLYQDVDAEEIFREQNSFHIKSQHLFIGGIIILLFLLFAIDRIHKKKS
jgi:hypothetical protein